MALLGKEEITFFVQKLITHIIIISIDFCRSVATVMKSIKRVAMATIWLPYHLIMHCCGT